MGRRKGEEGGRGRKEEEGGKAGQLAAGPVGVRRGVLGGAKEEGG